MEVLIVVDMQNDFITGSLRNKEAIKIVPNVINKIKSFNGEIFFTKDTHSKNYLKTKEGINLPVKHCIKNTVGWEIDKDIAAYIKNSPIEKNTFGSKKLIAILKKLNKKQKIESITLIGVCTDICVISNALLLKAYFPEIDIKVDSSCCAGVTVESHNNALNAMKMCQIEVY